MKNIALYIGLVFLALGHADTSFAQPTPTPEQTQAIENDPEYARLYKQLWDTDQPREDDDHSAVNALLNHVALKYGKETRLYLGHLQQHTGTLQYLGAGVELSRLLEEAVPLMEVVYGENSTDLMYYRNFLAGDLLWSGFPEKAIPVYLDLLNQKVAYTLLYCGRASGEGKAGECKDELTFAEPLKATLLTLFAAKREAEVEPTYRRVRDSLEIRWRGCDGPRWKFECERVANYKVAIDGAYAGYLLETDRTDQALALYETILADWLAVLENCKTSQTCKIIDDVNPWLAYDTALSVDERNDERMALAERVIPAAYAGELYFADDIARQYLELTLAAGRRAQAETFVARYDDGDVLEDAFGAVDAADHLARLRAETAGLSGEARVTNLRGIAESLAEMITGTWSQEYVDARLEIGRYYLEAGAPELAADEFRKLRDYYLDETVNSVDVATLATQYQAHALVESGQPDQAIETLRAILAHPDNIFAVQDVDFVEWGADPILDYRPLPHAKAQYAALLLGQEEHLADAVAAAKFSADYLNAYRDFIGFDPVEQASYAATLSEQPLSFDLRPAERFASLVEANWRLRQAGISSSKLLAEEAFAAAQDAMLGTTTLAIATTAAELLAKKQGVAGLLAEQKALQEEIQEFSVGEEEDRDETARAYADRLAAERRAVTRQEEIGLELRDTAPDFFRLIRPGALGVTDAQAMVAADEALLMILPTNLGTHIFLITESGLTWHRSDLTSVDIGAMVRELRTDLDPWGSGIAEYWGGGYDLETAYRLYEALIAPLRPALEGRSTIYFATTGSLASLPLSVLVTEDAGGYKSDLKVLRETKWLGDLFAIAQIPSLQSLRYLRGDKISRQDSASSPVRFAAFGDPVLGGQSVVRGARSGASVGKAKAIFEVQDPENPSRFADQKALRKLSQLPGTADELQAIQRIIGGNSSTVRLRAMATEASVKAEDLQDFSILAFATHGLLAGEANIALEPGLVLTPPASPTANDDGLLSASEILSLKLDADWVILSACNTAAADGEAGEGLSGLARAFFYAGARSLLASHWPVRDDTAPMLTSLAVSYWRNDPQLGRARALQRAMIDVRRDTRYPWAAHPSAWAPFVVVGDAK